MPEVNDRRGHVWWQRLRKPLAALFLLGVAALIVHYGMSVDWHAVGQALRKIDGFTLALAALCAAGSHLVYACTDLFALPIMAGRVRAGRSMAIAFVCYIFNLNLGSWVGSIGFRYRLYGRHGLKVAEVTRIIGLSLMTNWSGYLLLAGLAFSLRWIRLPPSWELGTVGLQLAGAGMLAFLLLCILASAFAGDREFRIFGRSLALPSLKVLLMQIGVSSCNWLFITGVLYVLLREHADYGTVLAVLAVAAIAGAVAHIPAGLGVTEGVFLALLSGRASHAELLAALLVFRAVYYLVPFVIALLTYAVLETRAPGATAGAVAGDA